MGKVRSLRRLPLVGEGVRGQALLLVGKEGQHPVGGLAGLRRGANDRVIVLAKAFQLSAATHNAKEGGQIA
ncbi:hypothetical protein KCX83_21435 [Brucella oryzae]|uniref:hypothetical protein n=1 Tax=Brucella oryzae TaxID=335286 RepID=UPI001B817071|nr:hypothetical protein [Brucella oryzae]